jgi:DNA-binding response OmpR family regulator
MGRLSGGGSNGGGSIPLAFRRRCVYNHEEKKGMNTKNKILVVDDDPVNRDFFQLMLTKLGYVVQEACDGMEALECLKKFHPDIILLDNVMPRMSGFELTKILKDDTKYQNIPIIMFSALDDINDKLAGFEIGIDDYITKPFNFTEVLARIKAVLRNYELLAQIAVRESRLNLAEVLNHDMKELLVDFMSSIDDLDSAVALIPGDLADTIQEKIKKIRKSAAELDTRIEKTSLEWDSLKEGEIGLSTLEIEIRKFLHQG